MVEVEHGALRALQQDVFPPVQRRVQQTRTLHHHRRQPGAEVLVLLDDGVCLQWEPAVDLRQDGVLLLEHHIQLLAEDLLVEQVLHADPDPGGLVRVRGADASLGGAKGVLAQVALRHLLQLDVIRHDQVRVGADAQVGMDAASRQLVDLGEQDPRVRDHPVRDHRNDVGIQRR